MERWKSSWGLYTCVCEKAKKIRQKDVKVARKMEKQLVVVEGNGRAAGKAEKHTAGEGGWKSSWARVGMEKRVERRESSREGGKASGCMKEHLGRWKSSRKNRKAAGGGGRGSREEQSVGGSRKASGKMEREPERRKSKRRGRKNTQEEGKMQPGDGGGVEKAGGQTEKQPGR